MSTLVVFAHGKESGPWGSKIQHLAQISEQHGAQVLSPDYRDIPEDPEARAKRLINLQLPEFQKLILVGSSMGAYVSIVASQKLLPEGLFLLAPAVDLPDYGYRQVDSPCANISVVAGWQDEIIPPEIAINFAKRHSADLHLYSAGHRLEEVLPQIGDLFSVFLTKIIGKASE